MKIVELKFYNCYEEKTTILMLDFKAVPLIMEWYGDYYAGDEYHVYVDGEEVQQGPNGECHDLRWIL